MRRQRAMLCQWRILWAIKISLNSGRACIFNFPPKYGVCTGSVGQRFLNIAGIFPQ